MRRALTFATVVAAVVLSLLLAGQDWSALTGQALDATPKPTRTTKAPKPTDPAAEKTGSGKAGGAAGKRGSEQGSGERVGGSQVVGSRKALLALVEAVCPAALDAGSCSDYVVKVGDTGEAEGETTIRFEPKVIDGHWTVRTRATTVTVHPRLVHATRDYALYVATHEWNHVEQAVLARTQDRYRAMERKAAAYFQPRARKGVSLKGTTGGEELLTDCMAWFGDDMQPGYEEDYPVSGYAAMYLEVGTMREACGKEWKALLPKR